MQEYNFTEIEQKWRNYWQENEIFKTPDDPKNKFYVLVMFAYPSGDIHMGHFRNYVLGDVVARYRMMRGFDVLHPFGWDAFGLPAERAAIKHNIHPRDWTTNNISLAKESLKQLGICYDWDREVTTCNPDYYKWTQWLFLLLYKMGLAYQAPSTVNWCETCHTILANEQAQGGVCWRCQSRVEKRQIDKCWFFKYSAYAERLLSDLDKLDKWPQNIKEMQRNWIGKSEGVMIDFKLDGTDIKLPVFTTRPDTIYGVTFLTIAPEHPLVSQLAEGSEYEKSVSDYIKKALQRSEIERTATGAKDGVFTGRYAVNPVSGERVPIYVADYVLITYGTGIVMGVPAHDQRDFIFAKTYNLPIKVVIQPKGSKLEPEKMVEAYTLPGVMVNSGIFDGMDSEEGIKKVIEFVEQKEAGKRETLHRLKDWLISRQRYWGCPIPVIHCPGCGIVCQDEARLPVLLPEGKVELLPKGRSPLEDLESYINTTCPGCNSQAKRDPDTMDTFMCSSFYLFRYCDPKNSASPWRLEEVKKWLPVDIYIGGAEHACMHLLYFRFITKVLYDAGMLHVDEPVVKLFNHGMVLDEKGEVMSSSKGNVVSPMQVVEKWGVDVSRLAMLFFAPSDQEIRWSEKGLVGARRFVHRFWRFINKLHQEYGDIECKIDSKKLSDSYRNIRQKFHEAVKRMNEAAEDDMGFNTAIAKIMEVINEAEGRHPPENESQKAVLREVTEGLVLLIAPMAPFLAEELWQRLGKTPSIFKVKRWPEYIPEAAIPKEFELVIQVNGKVRARINVPYDISKEEMQKVAIECEAIQRYIKGRQIKRVVVVPGKLVNIVV